MVLGCPAQKQITYGSSNNVALVPCMQAQLAIQQHSRQGLQTGSKEMQPLLDVNHCVLWACLKGLKVAVMRRSPLQADDLSCQLRPMTQGWLGTGFHGICLKGCATCAWMHTCPPEVCKDCQCAQRDVMWANGMLGIVQGNMPSCMVWWPAAGVVVQESRAWIIQQPVSLRCVQQCVLSSCSAPGC